MLRKLILIIIIIFIGFYPCFINAQEEFPKLANYYLPWDISDETALELSNWDLLILHTQAVDRNHDLLNLIKEKNPEIKILAYFLSQEIHQDSLVMDSDGAWGDIYQKVSESNWWLKDKNQDILNYWPETRLINITNNALLENNIRWNHWLPEYINENYLEKNELWDGIFYDNCWAGINWLNFDLELSDDLWFAGMTELLNHTQEIINQDKIVVCNGGTDYQDLYDGRMFETFPIISEGSWPVNLNGYLETGNYSIINVNTENSGGQDDYQKMRFGFGSTLLGDGYFSYDYGDQNHGQLWWYNEYDAYLGNSKGDSFNSAVWQRDFANGLVLVNSSGQSQYIELDGQYEKIKGEQDTLVNSGRIVNSVNLNPNDAVILLRPIGQITGASFTNGIFARIFDQEGANIRNGFFAYQQEFLGGKEILIADINKDNQEEYIVTNSNTVSIYNQEKELIKEFMPYGSSFNSGINLAVADLNNDGWREIITVPAGNATTHIKTFSADGRLLNPGFFAYSQSFKGGADVAVTDLNGNGIKEIIVGAGEGGGAHIQIFNKDGRLLSPGFFVFENSYRDGLNISAGDVDGDGKGEIVVSRRLGDSTIQIFNENGVLLNQWSGFKTGTENIDVAVSDLDNNGISEIIVLGSEPFTISLEN